MKVGKDEEKKKINSENNLQFTISISPKLWNNSMGFQCWPTHKNIAKKAIRFISNANYNSHTTPMFKNLHLLQAVDIFKLACFKFFYRGEMGLRYVNHMKIKK